MKELSIEQKAQRYDEAIKRANELNYVSDKDSLQRKTVEHIFPELKESEDESEDEKMRKAIIEGLKEMKNSFHTISSIKIDDAIAWLEKQGEHNMGISEATKKKLEDNLNRALEKETPESWNEFLDEQGKKIDVIKNFDTEFEKQVSYLIASIINKDCEYTESFVKWTADGLLNYAKHEIEKQGEQKETLCDKCKKAQPSHSCQDITALGRCAVEHEQKPVDKVEFKDYNSIDPHFGKPIDKIEPKFRNGQWIVWQDKYYKVNYNGCGYELVDQNGLSTSLEYGTVEESARVFAIQDAKDGDVLVDEDNNIGIHKEMEGLYWDSYIYLGCDGKLRGFSIGGSHKQANTHPATKEQCDLLFQKMHEAGYEWDAEKKELKKVENKKPLLSDFFKAEYERGKTDGQKLTEWSEEDERILNGLISSLARIGANTRTDSTSINYTFSREIDWLNSIKDRYTWKPSDEQMQALKTSYLYWKGMTKEVPCTEGLESLYEQLKKLKQ